MKPAEQQRGIDASVDTRTSSVAAESAFGQLTRAKHKGTVGSALRASEGRFRAMFEGSPIGTALLGLDARYIAANPALQTMLGYTSEELHGKFVWEHYPDKSSAAPLAYLGKLLSGETPSYRREQRYIRRDGQVIFAQLTAALLRDDNGNAEFGLCMIEDITERKQLEARLRQAQKMEAVGRFAGGIAHDFNNTLSTITAYAQILFDALPESDERRADASEILKVASRAAGLTRQLLSFSRTKAVDFELVDLCAAVQEFGALLGPLLPASIRLVTNSTCESVTVHTDRTQLHQVLMNLALNARDAMPDGGTLTIEVAQSPSDEARSARTPETRAAAHAVLTVSDSGTGIPEEVRAHLFEPFFTTKSDTHGTGLGLTTVYTIVRQAGGSVTVESQPGRGSRFTVRLPVAHGPTPATSSSHSPSTPSAPVTPAAREIRTTVLLAEDEPSVREAARRLLHRAGIRVITACNGVEALKVLQDGESVDVLMTDVTMPVMGGVELIKRASGIRPEMRVIVISGHADTTDGNLHTLGDVLLEKPFSADSLISAVQSVATLGTTRGR
jgi:two-component system, cell cycle sensor histidine kinase and response regulator CckA